MGQKVTGFLIDVEQKYEGEKSLIQLYIRTKKGLEIIEDKGFQPYFYAILRDPEKAGELKETVINETGGKPERVEKDEARGENVFKVVFASTKDLAAARKDLGYLSFVKEIKEYDIPFTRRYLIDKGLKPWTEYAFEFGEEGLESAKEKEGKIKLKMAALDIETYSPGRFSDAKRDPAIMISLADGKEEMVYTWKKELKGHKGVKVYGNEAEMIQAVVDDIKAKDLDALVTYNGDSFDMPYLVERSHIYRQKFDIGRDGSEPVIKRLGMSNSVIVKGMQHIDAFQLVRLLSRLGAVSLVKFDLESVYGKLFETEKEKVHHEDIVKIWENNDGLERLVEYNREDASSTLKIAEKFLVLLSELSRLVRALPHDVGRTTASNLVEYLLFNQAFELKTLVPNKPGEEQVKQRSMSPIEGGWVKEPLPGLHENIGVLDFRSLYPSLIISHNISPETLDCKHEKCRQENSAPTAHWFCREAQGFLPIVLKKILDARIAIKKEMKGEKISAEKRKELQARQQALKILLNSHYGYLLYSRSRWYSRESGRAITHWAKHYIQKVNEKAEKEGMTPLYSDTDSAFLLVPKERGEKEVKDFAKKVNDELPEGMELEFEGMFKRGIFVTKKEGGAAKKRYALMDYKDNLKIVGFEYVRRDWSPIAKNTQRKVLELVLKEGKPEKALKYTREVIERLKKGNVGKSELVVTSQIQKPLGSYESVTPHTAAAKKAIERGQTLGVGSVIGYIITSHGGKSISEKAEMEEYVQEGDYDSDYYIKNQVVPAVIKVMRELGYSEQDLIEGGRQSSLSAFV